VKIKKKKFFKVTNENFSPYSITTTTTTKEEKTLDDILFHINNQNKHKQKINKVSDRASNNNKATQIAS
jgi:hypothetical protein